VKLFLDAAHLPDICTGTGQGNPGGVVMDATCGAGDRLCDRPLTDIGIERFDRDWKGCRRALAVRRGR
jgi:hypothetical protein